MSSEPTVFVKGFPLETNQEQLADYFETIGQIQSVKIIKNFAFITFKTLSDVEKAVNQFNGKTFPKSRYRMIVEATRGRIDGGNRQRGINYRGGDRFSQNQSPALCFLCKKEGHKKFECPEKREFGPAIYRRKTEDLQSSNERNRRKYSRSSSEETRRKIKRGRKSSSSDSSRSSRSRSSCGKQSETQSRSCRSSSGSSVQVQKSKKRRKQMKQVKKSGKRSKSKKQKRTKSKNKKSKTKREYQSSSVSSQRRKSSSRSSQQKKIYDKRDKFNRYRRSRSPNQRQYSRDRNGYRRTGGCIDWDKNKCKDQRSGNQKFYQPKYRDTVNEDSRRSQCLKEAKKQEKNKTIDSRTSRSNSKSISKRKKNSSSESN